MSTARERIKAFKRNIKQASQTQTSTRTYGPTKGESTAMVQDSESPPATMTSESMLDRFRKRFNGKMNVTSTLQSRKKGGMPTMGINTIQSGSGFFSGGKRSRVSMSKTAATPTAFAEEQFFQDQVETVQPPVKLDRSPLKQKSRPKSTPNPNLETPVKTTVPTSVDDDWNLCGSDQFPSFFGMCRARLRERISIGMSGPSAPPEQVQEIERLADTLLAQCRDFVKTDEREAEHVFGLIERNAAKLQALLASASHSLTSPTSASHPTPHPSAATLIDVDDADVDGDGDGDGRSMVKAAPRAALELELEMELQLDDHDRDADLVPPPPPPPHSIDIGDADVQVATPGWKESYDDDHAHTHVHGLSVEPIAVALTDHDDDHDRSHNHGHGHDHGHGDDHRRHSHGHSHSHSHSRRGSDQDHDRDRDRDRDHGYDTAPRILKPRRLI